MDLCLVWDTGPSPVFVCLLHFAIDNFLLFQKEGSGLIPDIFEGPVRDKGVIGKACGADQHLVLVPYIQVEALKLGFILLKMVFIQQPVSIFCGKLKDERKLYRQFFPFHQQVSGRPDLGPESQTSSFKRRRFVTAVVSFIKLSIHLKRLHLNY